MKHDEIVKQLVADAESNSNILGLLLFGSVATGTHREDSDIDVITILRKNKPTSGIINTSVDGIKVGAFFLTYDVLAHSVETVPYLLHPFWEAKLLFDRDGRIKDLLERISKYYSDNLKSSASGIVTMNNSKKRRRNSSTRKPPSLMCGMSSKNATLVERSSVAFLTLST